MLATLGRAPFDDPAWAYEPKWGGFRVIAMMRGGSVQLLSRNLHPFTALFRPITESLKGFPTLTLLREILEAAVSWSRLPSNPTRGIRPVATVRREMRVWTTAEIRKFLLTAEDGWRPLFAVAIFSGLRAGEIQALAWGSQNRPNFVTNKIEVTCAYSRTARRIISKAGSPLLRTLLIEAAHSLARWDSGPLGQFYTRKTQEVGPRKAIIALAQKLLIVAWRMLQTGEVYRAARTMTVTRRRRAGFRWHQCCRLGIRPAPSDG